MGKKKSANKLPPFVPLVLDMLNGKAYKNLPASAAKALPYFLSKVKTSYNDTQRCYIEFSISYREAMNYGFAAATFSKVIQALVSYGFVDPVDKGGLRSDGKSLNLFRLSHRWKKYGTTDFESADWKCFLPRLNSRATSKREMNSFKKGKGNTKKGKVISHFEAVEGISE